MVNCKLSAVLLLPFVLPAFSVPLTHVAHHKRIAQTIADSTTQWVAACTAAGGGEQCNPISVTAFSTLLAAAGPCDQQDSADQMIDLAKTLNNDPDMIKFAQIFAQQPRNTPTSQAVPYCQSAPKNPELNGLFQCQFQGANEKTFVGGIAVGGAGTIPFGMTSPVSPPGSCPANPSGPIADGTQLVSITQNPGVPGSSSGNTTAASSASATAASVSATDAAPTDSATSAPAATSSAVDAPLPSSSATDSDTSTDTCAPAATATVTTTVTVTAGSSDPSAASSSISNIFAPPPSSVVASATAVASSAADSATVVFSSAAPSATDSSSPATDSTIPTAVSVTATGTASAAASTSSNFQLANGQAAQALNKQFAGLTANSTCTAGDEACIAGGFAQCVNGAFVSLGCSTGTQCFALPLVNKPGTSIACTTQSDAEARISATGATGGVSGSGN